MKNQPIIVGGGEGSFFKKTWGSWKIAAVASFSAVVFGLAILLMSIMAVANPLRVFLQEAAESAQVTTVEYYLPYPGLLPDSRLYKLKMVRDRVRLWLARDEVKKAQLELLYADKRINAAEALVSGGKVALAVTTATKAEKYLGQAVDRILRLAGSGRDVKSQLEVFSRAVAKHLEVAERITARTSGSEKEVMEASTTSTKTLGERVEQARIEAK